MIFTTATAIAAVKHHPIGPIIFLVLLHPVIAQSPPANFNQPYTNFTPSIAIIIAILVAALFFMGFFSIYIRHCSDSSGGASVARRALSIRNRRLAAARGLDADVINTFPIFTYAEVKEHKIAKGALECAVCLCEFGEDETLRLIPKCDHVFHPECIDAWLESHVTCPVCRANLVPGSDSNPVENTTPVQAPEEVNNVTMERNTSLRNEEVVVQVDGNEENQEPKMNRNASFQYPTRPQRSWSVPTFGFGKFRSHSTGHSLVQPGDNLERFTLRLPAQIRKEMMDRAELSRTGSLAGKLPTEGSSRRGYRGEGSSRGGRSYRRIERDAKSDRWVFFTRALSIRSPKVVAETVQESGSTSKNKNPVKMPSFNCLEPKGVDEARLFSSDDSGKSPV